MERDECLRRLKYHSNRAQARMKNLADSHRKDRELVVGDWVFLKLRPHVQQSVKIRINPKLAPHYYGPFQVIGRVGVVSYNLQLPPSSRIHPVFHISLLKKVVGIIMWRKSCPRS